MNPATLGLALAQLLLMAAVGWVGGDLLVRAALGDGDLPEGVGLPERALGAVVGGCIFAVALMALHAATGGAVFGTPGMVPASAAALLLVGWRRGIRPPSNLPWIGLGVLALVLAAVFLIPVLIGGSSLRTGDTPLHMGWTEELLAGEELPSGPAPVFGRNAYPWGFHALLATAVRLVPGSDPATAHEALHIGLLVAIPLAAACLARRVDPRAGWAAAVAAALVGGWGWIAAEGPDFVASPRLALYGADLVVASPNSMYELFPPALPREVGLVTLAGAGVLLAAAAGLGRARIAAVAGVVLGVTGLISVPMLVAGLGWALAAALVSRRGARIRLLVATLLPCAAVFALWLVPVVVNFFRYGGFVDVTPLLGVEWPLPSALWSWGLLLPAALAGVFVTARGQPSCPVLWFGVSSFGLLAVSIARGRWGWDFGGNATLLHQGRVWPPLHLLAAAFAGVAAVALYRALAGRNRAGAAAAIAGVIVIGAISPVFASIALTKQIETHDFGFLYSRPDFDPDAFIPVAADKLRSRAVVRVEGSNFLGLMLFQFSGARLAEYDDRRFTHNELRIRYQDLANAWDERMATGGFEADYLVTRASAAPEGASVAASGDFRNERWLLINVDEPASE